MANLNQWHRRYHMRVLRSYVRLTLAEKGAANTLLDLIYAEGGPIELDYREISSWFGSSVKTTESVIARLIKYGKFKLTEDGRIINAVAAGELESVRKSRENGKKREKKVSKKSRKKSHNPNETNELGPKNPDKPSTESEDSLFSYGKKRESVSERFTGEALERVRALRASPMIATVLADSHLAHMEWDGEQFVTESRFTFDQANGLYSHVFEQHGIRVALKR